MRERYGIEAPLLLIYVGRIAPEKDIATLLAAMRLLPDSIATAAHLLIVGDGPQLPELRAAAPQNVTFSGSKYGEELAELYATGDLFVFPSCTETFGNVVLEAMASGLPVIAADAGGSRDLVVSGRSGTLFEPHNPAAMAEAICRLAEQPELRMAMGQEGRRLALSRSWDHIFDGLISDYQEVIEGRRIKSGSGIFTA
ncbi:GDP-mannose-dependent alpha-mannosyltransferase [compost metagenome]